MSTLKLLSIASTVKLIDTDLTGRISAITVRGANYQIQYEIVYWQDGRRCVWVNAEEVEPIDKKAILTIGF